MAFAYKPRPSIGVKSDTTAPEQVDYNLWLGPAPEQGFNANYVHYNWHWFWDFGNGDIGNQGVHQMDVARWLIPGATLPKSVLSLGGRFGYSDQGQTANTQMTVMDFGDTQLIFEVRGLKTDGFHGEKVGNILHFEEGVVAPVAKGLRVPPQEREGRRGRARGEGGRSQAEDPVTATSATSSRECAVRKTDELNADILEGHYSSALCHLANISYRLGESVPFNTQTKAFGENKEAYETLARMEEHLTKGNGLKLEGTLIQARPQAHGRCQGRSLRERSRSGTRCSLDPTASLSPCQKSLLKLMMNDQCSMGQ